jgi:hypothetical protein
MINFFIMLRGSMAYWETRLDFEERCGEVHTSLEIVLHLL